MANTDWAARWRVLIRRLCVALLVLLVLVALFCIWFFNLYPQRAYAAQDFGIEPVFSGRDANGNGVDDYTDLMLGARIDAQNKPRYDGAYWQGGYPPQDIGVCTDLVWRAFDYAGYDLKTLVDADIAADPALYPGLDDGVPDPNIDFRRVRNLKVFFDRHAVPLTLDLAQTEQWQPGDIVTFRTHIGIVSDKRNADGLPYLIHNSGQPLREENALGKLALFWQITGHYRWQPGQSADSASRGDVEAM